MAGGALRTDARIGLGRVGHSLHTREILSFQLAHAKARDAVHRALDVRCFARLHPLLLRSAAADRRTYLQRPDLGRRLAPESAARLEHGEWDAVIVIGDGLSAAAVERHALPLIDALVPDLPGWGSSETSATTEGRGNDFSSHQGGHGLLWRLAPFCIVEQARVAIGDEIGERLGAALAVVLIGERPGLSSPDSMGAYLTWQPRIGRTDAERNCVSNIRTEGLLPELAAVRVATIMRAARERQVTGVELNLAGLPSLRDRS